MTLSFDQPDILVLAKTIGGEARGESYEGQVAVGWCIRNRVELDLNQDDKPDWWGEGITAVCMKPFQFSCWNPGDPNLSIIRFSSLIDLWLVRAFGIACLVISGDLPDYSRGATHYYDKRMALLPGWAEDKTPTAEIGHHRFFRLL